ncbi:hypothetical protein DXG01_010297, partial [Tephrocybe rancida]
TSGYNSEGGDQPDCSEDEPEIGNDKREPDGEQGKGESDTQGSGGGEGTATPRIPEKSNLPDASLATPADGGRGADKARATRRRRRRISQMPLMTTLQTRDRKGGMDVDGEFVDEGSGKGSDEDEEEEEEEEEDKPSAPHDSSTDKVQGGMDIDGESADEGGSRGPAATSKDKGGGDDSEYLFSVLINLKNLDEPSNSKVLTAAKASDTGIQFSSKSAFVVYGATEQSNPPYIPRGHAWFQITSIERNMEMLQANYQNMLPKHIVNKDKSVFKIVTCDTYCGMTLKAVTDMLVTHNVVITSNTCKNLAFNEDTLLRIAPLNQPIGVHDPSEPTLIQGRATTLRQLLEVVCSSHSKAINALELPLSEDPMPQEKFTSDIFAHKDVCSKEFFSKDQNVPLLDIRWGLVSMGDTRHNFHINGNGFATAVKVLTGRKLWIIAMPKDKEMMDPSANIDLYTGGFDNNMLLAKDYSLEYVVLQADKT